MISKSGNKYLQKKTTQRVSGLLIESRKVPPELMDTRLEINRKPSFTKHLPE